MALELVILAWLLWNLFYLFQGICQFLLLSVALRDMGQIELLHFLYITTFFEVFKAVDCCFVRKYKMAVVPVATNICFTNVEFTAPLSASFCIHNRSLWKCQNIGYSLEGILNSTEPPYLSLQPCFELSWNDDNMNSWDQVHHTETMRTIPRLPSF